MALVKQQIFIVDRHTLAKAEKVAKRYGLTINEIIRAFVKACVYHQRFLVRVFKYPKPKDDDIAIVSYNNEYHPEIIHEFSQLCKKYHYNRTMVIRNLIAEIAETERLPLV